MAYRSGPVPIMAVVDHPAFDMGEPSLPPLPEPGDPDPFAGGRITSIERHPWIDELALVTRWLPQALNSTVLVEFMDEAIAEARRQGGMTDAIRHLIATSIGDAD